MTLKKKFISGIGTLAFMAVLALNVQLVNSYSANENGFPSLSIVELAAHAQLEGDGGSGGPTIICPDASWTFGRCHRCYFAFLSNRCRYTGITIDWCPSSCNRGY